MSNQLEKFIQMHKQELSSLTPPDHLWLSINTSIPKHALIKSKVSWLKYFAYSASAAAITVSLAVFTGKTRTPPVAETKTIPPAASVVASEFPSAQQPVPELQKELLTVESVTVDTPEVPAVPAIIPVKVSVPAVPVAPVAPVHPVSPVPDIPPVKPVMNGQEIGWTVTSTGELKADTSFTGIKKVELYVSACDVFIQPSALNKTFFKADISSESHGLVLGGKDEYHLICKIKDSVLSIMLENTCKKRIVAGSYIENAVINMDVPDNVQLNIKNSYGNLVVKGLKASRYDFETSSGDIMLNDLTADLFIKSGYGYVSATNTKGNINASLASGDLSVSQLQGNAEISSSYGNQVYKDVTGSLKIRSTSGDVQIDKMTGNTEIKSNYGNISLNAYEGTPLLEAVSGDITGKNVLLRSSMTAKSSYGNIRMNLLNDAKELSFDLQTSYGKINVNKNGAKAEDDTKVQIKQGDILITGITTSGDQTYK
jgi:hypothetical protein